MAYDTTIERRSDALIADWGNMQKKALLRSQTFHFVFVPLLETPSRLMREA